MRGDKGGGRGKPLPDYIRHPRPRLPRRHPGFSKPNSKPKTKKIKQVQNLHLKSNPITYCILHHPEPKPKPYPEPKPKPYPEPKPKPTPDTLHLTT